MRPARKPNTILQNITVIDIAEEGKGVGKTDELVVFIEKAIPGDVVDVEVYRKKKNFAEAKIIELKKPSDFRTEAFCSHFGVCGGCKWQHMLYDAQLVYKQKSVTDALQRIAKLDLTGLVHPILPSEQTSYYRNKLEYTFSNKRWLTDGEVISEDMELNALGFHVPGRFDKILDIEHCYLQADPSNPIRNRVREYALLHNISFYDIKAHTGALRNLIIRTSSTGELMVIVVFAHTAQDDIDGLMAFIADGFPEITSLSYIVNQKMNDTIFDQEVITYSGRDYIYEAMPTNDDGTGVIQFRIGPKSFYQTNSKQALRLYQIARNFGRFSGDELVYDLYTGAGTIANFVAGQVKQVIGVEYVPQAIEDAKVNSAINNISNTKFFAGDMKDVLTPEFVAEHGKPDVIITDPPRAGMHPDVVNRLMEIEAEKIVYVSCNAATQARDLLVLKEKYEVLDIQPVDMFPHTQHVENVVLLRLR
ncbi:23S rRNA (uracil(1939)-C(5))-methyltransferase RlmD [uncultured Mucilaginibacter sp.]|uniref:23S rRNA (uracil(1939)-C(5))-methyltransferase RlmD n=1 Tax=uncultured Mucilaginibacter sp. TaxID=797541 RepID=UPI0025DE4DB7|nr:23S rRNA (uracil(1939)-C(5))-methyltransferase RlmD [uncultured Mucilaginibacter sp.]